MQYAQLCQALAASPSGRNKNGTEISQGVTFYVNNGFSKKAGYVTLQEEVLTNNLDSNSAFRCANFINNNEQTPSATATASKGTP